MELKLESSDVDGADEALLAARLHVHHPSHAHHRVDVLQAHLQEGNITLCLHIRWGPNFLLRLFQLWSTSVSPNSLRPSVFSHEGPQEQGNPSRSTWQACFSFLSRQGGRPIKDSSLCFYVLCHPYSFINHLALNASKGTLTGERLTRSNAGTSALLSTLSQNILRATKCKTYIKHWCLSLEDHLTHAGLCKKTTNPP